MSALTASHGELLAAAERRLRRHAVAERRWATLTMAIGAAIVALIALLCFGAPLLGVADPDKQDLLAALEPPSLQHLFGTDSLGRDIFSRALYGGRIDLTVGIVTTYVPLLFGVTVGMLAGWYGGWVDMLVMRLVDIVLAFPFIVLVLAIVAIFGPGLTGVYVGLMIGGWALYARLTRAEMLVLRERQFMLAAQTLALPTRRILMRHALPNLLRPSLVFSMADIVLNILILASLSYLGAGVRPPTPEWGVMIAEGQSYLLSAWWIATLPGVMIVLVGVGFSLLGDGLADRLGEELRLTA